MIRYQLTIQEVVQGLLKYRKFRLRVWSGIIVGTCGIFWLAWGFWLTQPMKEVIIAEGYLMFIISISALLIAPIRIRHAYSKVVQGNPVFTASKEVTFHEQGIVFISPNQQSELKWAAFKRITQDDLYIYLHADLLGSVTLLPKRAFDPASMEKFLRCTNFPARA